MSSPSFVHLTPHMSHPCPTYAPPVFMPIVPLSLPVSTSVSSSSFIHSAPHATCVPALSCPCPSCVPPCPSHVPCPGPCMHPCPHPCDPMRNSGVGQGGPSVFVFVTSEHLAV